MQSNITQTENVLTVFKSSNSWSETSLADIIDDNLSC